jgi:hypothetical protein
MTGRRAPARRHAWNVGMSLPVCRAYSANGRWYRTDSPTVARSPMVGVDERW